MTELEDKVREGYVSGLRDAVVFIREMGHRA